MSIEKYLVEHCSLTLASLKTASLFTVSYSCEKELDRQVEYWNKLLFEKGVLLFVLKKKNKKALVYVCRQNMLESILAQESVFQFLKKFGYESSEFYCALNRLKYRLETTDCFPHEIGVFLGYPLADVVGFIENCGKNHKCLGCWKVYSDEDDTLKLFKKFEKCNRVYQKLWNCGRTVSQLTVALK